MLTFLKGGGHQSRPFLSGSKEQASDKNDIWRWSLDFNDEDAKIVVCCMMGPMGDIAAEKLASMGYTRVSNFQGGMMAWTQAGRHLQRRQR
jgi:rhodanese-related sulfurtransferase